MIRVSYKDVEQNKEIAYPCCAGAVKAITITGVPTDISVNTGIVSCGEGDEIISFSVEHKNKTVTVKPCFKSDTLPKCMMIKDSLLLIPLNKDDFLLRLRTSCSKGKFNRYMLVLDLGNTRTCALTCSTLWDADDDANWEIHPLEFIPLSMRLNYDSDSSHKCASIFSSKCVLGTNVHKDHTRSFIQLARNADDYLRQKFEQENEGHNAARRWYLSGPKRYFWKHDTLRCQEGSPRRSTSQFWFREGTVEQQPSEDQEKTKSKGHSFRCNFKILDLPLAKAMAQGVLPTDEKMRTYAFDNGFMPYSLFLKGMLWELMEQSEIQVNQEEDKEYPFQLTDLVVTFPAVWSEEERRNYEKQIRETADLYAQYRCINSPEGINVDVTCDEGMAVLTTYVYSEFSKKEHSNLNNTHLAVIDVGGGTSDLVIARVEIKENKTYNEQLHLQALFANGTNDAGDEFIRNLVTNYIVPSVLGAIFPDIGQKRNEKHRIEIQKLLTDIITTQQYSDTVREQLSAYVFDLWYPLALQLLEKLDSAVSTAENPDGNISFDSSDYDGIINEFRQVITQNAKGTLKTWVERQNDGKSNQTLHLLDSEYKEVSPGDFISLVKKSIENTFHNTIEMFTSKIAEFQCKTILFSGKICDNPLFLDVLKEFIIARTSDKIKLVSMNGYDFKNLPTHGYNSDSKFATVTGASLHHLVKHRSLGNNKFDMQILDSKANKNMQWGWNRTSGYDSRNSRAAIDRRKDPLYLGRRSDDKAAWIQSYELRANPFRNVRIHGDDIVDLSFSVDENNIPKPEFISGRFFLDDQEYDSCEMNLEEWQNVCREAFEFRICKIMPGGKNSIDGISWLDSGMVFES